MARARGVSGARHRPPSFVEVCLRSLLAALAHASFRDLSSCECASERACAALAACPAGAARRAIARGWAPPRSPPTRLSAGWRAAGSGRSELAALRRGRLGASFFFFSFLGEERDEGLWLVGFPSLVSASCRRLLRRARRACRTRPTALGLACRGLRTTCWLWRLVPPFFCSVPRIWKVLFLLRSSRRIVGRTRTAPRVLIVRRAT